MLVAPKHTESTSHASRNENEPFFKPRAQAKPIPNKAAVDADLEPDKIAEKTIKKKQEATHQKPVPDDLTGAKETAKETDPQKVEELEKLAEPEPAGDAPVSGEKANPSLPAKSVLPASNTLPDKAILKETKEAVEPKMEEEAPASEDQALAQGPVTPIKEEEAPASEDQALAPGQVIQTEIEEAPASEDQALAPGQVVQATDDKESTPENAAKKDPEVSDPKPQAAQVGKQETTETAKEGDKKEGKKEGEPELEEGGEKQKGEGAKKEDPGPEGVVEDYKNPPVAKEVKLDAAADAAGEPIEIDESAHTNMSGLIMTAQQFRDQGKEAMDRAEEQTQQRLSFESDIKELGNKVKTSDRDLTKADGYTAQREGNLAKMDRHVATSKNRQAAVAAGVGKPIASYNEGKGKAKDLEKESKSLVSGSAKHSDKKNKDSGRLGSKLNELSSGASTISEGIMGGGDTANKLKQDAQAAKAKNAQSDAEMKGARAEVKKSKKKIKSDKDRNTKAKAGMNKIKPKLAESKKKETVMKNEGKSLMKTSFDIENETHRAQYFYYKDMKEIPGREGMLEIEVKEFEQELANMAGAEGLLFAYARMETNEAREAFIQKLSPNERILLAEMLNNFMANHDAWMEAKQTELILRVEKKRGEKEGAVNQKRGEALQTPLNRVTENLDKVSKTGLIWTSLTQSLSGIWKGITSITWSDVGGFALAMINPMETWRTISGSVMGIYNDLRDWGGFSKDPVGMILQKGSSVGVKLLTISGVITGILGILTIAATVGAVFTLGALAPLAAWLAGATITMGTITFWIGVVTAILSVLSGIKNIFDLHSAKTSEEVYKETADLKKDAANTGVALLGIVGGKGTVKAGGSLKNTLAKYPKTFGKRAFVNMKNGLIRSLTWAPRTVKALFRKDTWQGLAASLKRFMSRNSDELVDDPKALKTTKAGDKKSSPASSKNKPDSELDNDNFNKRKNQLDEGQKKKLKKDADDDIPDGPNKDSKRKALFAAKVITEANDKIDTPVPAVLAELSPLVAFKGVTGFGSKQVGPGVHKIVMYGSEHEVDNNYTDNREESAFDERGKLKPNSEYKTGEFNYTGRTDSQGRLSSVETDDLQLANRDRLSHNPNTPGKIDGDHAGHLIGDRFGGSPELDNLISQSRTVNLSTFKIIENAWARAIEAGKQVTMEIKVNYIADELRPSSFEVFWEIDGQPYSQLISN